MKLLQTFVVAGLLTGTACQQMPSKTENVSADTGSSASAVAGAEVDEPTAPQLEPSVRRLKEQLTSAKSRLKSSIRPLRRPASSGRG